MEWKHGKAGRNSSQAAPAHFSLDLYVCIEKEKALQQRQTGLIQLKLEEDVPHREGGKEHGWSAWSAPSSPAEALVRVAPLRVPVAPLDSSRMASHTHARQVLVRRASRRSWSNVGGRGRLPAFKAPTVVRERRILRRPAGCVQASRGMPPPLPRRRWCNIADAGTAARPPTRRRARRGREESSAAPTETAAAANPPINSRNRT